MCIYICGYLYLYICFYITELYQCLYLYLHLFIYQGYLSSTTASLTICICVIPPLFNCIYTCIYCDINIFNCIYSCGNVSAALFAVCIQANTLAATTVNANTRTHAYTYVCMCICVWPVCVCDLCVCVPVRVCACAKCRWLAMRSVCAGCDCATMQTMQQCTQPKQPCASRSSLPLLSTPHSPLVHNAFVALWCESSDARAVLLMLRLKPIFCLQLPPQQAEEHARREMDRQTDSGKGEEEAGGRQAEAAAGRRDVLR